MTEVIAIVVPGRTVIVRDLRLLCGRCLAVVSVAAATGAAMWAGAAVETRLCVAMGGTWLTEITKSFVINGIGMQKGAAAEMARAGTRRQGRTIVNGACKFIEQFAARVTPAGGRMRQRRLPKPQGHHQ